MRELKELSVLEIRLRPRAGSDLIKCSAEAVLLAVEERSNVVFTHNDKEYRVFPSDIVGDILKAATPATI